MNPDLPPGLYEQLVTLGLRPAMEGLGARHLIADLSRMDDAEGPVLLARHVAKVLEEALVATNDASKRVVLVNDLLARLAELVPSQDSTSWLAGPVAIDARPILRAVRPPSPTAALPLMTPPEIGLSQSDLLVNAHGEPNLLRGLTSEISSADRIDFVVSFIRWTGLRLLKPQLESAAARGAQIRVLTTTYLGASELKAINELVQLGARVKVSYDGRVTRLHAKGWLFERNSGFATAYIGSSNLSHAAMVDGQEWNVRLAQAQTPELVDKFRATFAAYWDDPGQGFDDYDPDRDSQVEARLRDALLRAKGGPGTAQPDGLELLPFELQPFPFQQEMLDDLDREREVYNRYRNLVVAATGTGKTVVAAFDYRRLAASWRSGTNGPLPRLLFVAHRAEILRQSRRMFQHVLRRGDFGELLVDGEEPVEHGHVFASVQSLSRGNRLAGIPEDYYDVVIVDEFHHAEAATYRRLLDHVKPRVLLGLTATPERADGADLLHWFGGRIATELRLWEALDRGLLTPFHYFGVGHEDLDFRRAKWSGGYRAADLDQVVTGNDVLAGWVVQQIRDKVSDPRRMRALAFASSVNHARFLADHFVRAGLASVALDADTPSELRREVVQRLRDGDLQIIVTVDLFNEGIDVPEVDTVLLLRPTESATVFLQQLGRGLRRHDGKDVLTVLDFIGFQHQAFRFDLRFRALTGVSRQALVEAVEHGFPYLPAGSFIGLDRVAQQAVLQNIRDHVPSTRAKLIDDVRAHAALRGTRMYSLGDYLTDAVAERSDVYGKTNLSWTQVCRDAGLEVPEPGSGGPEEEELLLRRVRALAHVDDLPRITAYSRFVEDPDSADSPSLTPHERRFAAMLYYTIWPSGRDGSIGEGLRRLTPHPAVVQELLQVWEVARRQIPYRTTALELPLGESVPLRVHARYSREEMLAGLGWAYLRDGQSRVPAGHSPGTREIPDLKADAFDVTWRKSDVAYSPTTMYRDYAISPRTVHWESPNALRADSPTARRYIEHEQHGRHVLLFARESKQGPLGTQPLMFLGPAQYVSHQGERPISFTWNLDVPMPAEFYLSAQLLAG